MREEINYRGLSIPFAQLGERVTTDNLFDPNEQVIFDFYEANKARYRRAVDIGANVGVHSILMARCGWEVRAYEPDPAHFGMLLRNVFTHGADVWAVRAAVSDSDGTAGFVRVLGNTTASHIRGAREAHGALEYYDVKTVDVRPLLAWADFVKVDCEGHEATLVEVAPTDAWRRTDVLLEVGSSDAARRIYDHLRWVVPMWAQKIRWGRVLTFLDMPTHHSQGSLFVGARPPFPV